jgi:hypothetical protein
VVWSGGAVRRPAGRSGIRSRLIDLGFEIFPSGQQSPEVLDALVKADAEKWWPVIKELGITAE